MRLHHQAWVAVSVLLGVLLAMKFWCWRPGIGGGGSNRPGGIEMELFYGWPATYQAEWWRSEDTALGGRLLETAPFCRPGNEMELQARYLGIFPALADFTFAVAALVAVGVVVESALRESCPRWAVVNLVLALVAMGLVLSVADRIGEHL